MGFEEKHNTVFDLEDLPGLLRRDQHLADEL